MPPLPLPRFTILLALAAVAATLPACSGDDDPAGPGGNQDAYVGTWTVTSFEAQGMDFIAEGMTLQATLTTSTYSFTVTGDQVGVCGGTATSCTTNGDISATSSQITIDAGDPDAIAFNYTVSGSTMTWTGSIDGIPATITLSKVS